MRMPDLRVLAVEPYYGGSHRAVLDGLVSRLRPLGIEMDCLTLPARKWKWRMRGAGIVLGEEARLRATVWQNAHRGGESQRPRPDIPWDVIYASTFINLCEFCALAGDAVSSAATIVYFHENQLTYPVQSASERDYQFPLTNITSALAADRCIFNSRYNRDSFLSGIPAFLRSFPDCHPKNVDKRIAEKTQVLAPPFNSTLLDAIPLVRGALPRIIWPHRWEHDKDPAAFMQAVTALALERLDFEVVIAGKPHPDTQGSVEQMASNLGERIVHIGQPESLEAYAKLLRSSDVAVSTARNEFFGLAMIEAAYAGCMPIVPDRLVYPEIYPSEYRYASPQELIAQLRDVVTKRPLCGTMRVKTEEFSFDALVPKYNQLFREVAQR